MTNIFAYNLLKYVADKIRNNEIISKDKLVKNFLSDSLPNQTEQDISKLAPLIEQHIAHLLEPNQDVPFIRFLNYNCEGCADQLQRCIECCPTKAISIDANGKHVINNDLCIECGMCVDACVSKLIIERSDFARVAKMLLEKDDVPVYAIMAPSFVGQFGSAEPEQVKGAFLQLGFSEVYEVALAADVVTTLEAEEFCHRIQAGEEFMITSCCCPAFIKLIEKRRPNLTRVVSESLSPMVVLGRMLKSRTPGSKVVFIGPCVAKKAEAIRPELADAIDCVLTFKETQALLDASGLAPLISMDKIPMEDASHDGRIFAHTGGVTTAISRAIHEIDPALKVIAVKGNGIKECMELLSQAEDGTLKANFMEGMACPGGCVGGPGTIILSDEGADYVENHAKQSPFTSALDNNQAQQWFHQYTTIDMLNKES